ncbi:MAG TPA: hypothetical protein VEW69_02015 [Alphaproteobacteria bacterium]|nr:hypothetical protein [Alphaproteobacteria bacterium]
MRQWAFASLLLIVVLSAAAIAQVQTVGDISFAVPEGWTYQAAQNGGAMVLKQGQNFWIISVHPPRPTTGDPNTDFKAAWRSELSTLPDFQRSLPGYDPYSINKGVLGYPGKYYDAISDSGRMYSRLYTLETGKVVVPVAVLTVNRQVLDALNHIVEAVVGSVRVAPLKASPIRNTLTMADLVGEWQSGMASSRTYYDRYTGAYAGSSTTAYSARYQIASDGTFTYEMGGLWNSRPVQDKDTGVVALSGDLVTFKGRGHTTSYHFVNLQTAIDGSTVMTLLPGQEDPAKANVTALQQQLVREGKK